MGIRKIVVIDSPRLKLKNVIGICIRMYDNLPSQDGIESGALVQYTLADGTRTRRILYEDEYTNENLVEVFSSRKGICAGSVGVYIKDFSKLNKNKYGINTGAVIEFILPDGSHTRYIFHHRDFHFLFKTCVSVS